MKRRGLPLRNFRHLAVKLGTGRLIKADRLGAADVPDRLQKTQRPEPTDVRRINRLIERDADMALRAKIIHLIRLRDFDQLLQPTPIGQIAVVEKELEVLFVNILEDVGDAPAVERRRAADDAMNLIALRQEQLCEIGTVLAGDP